MTKLAMLGSQPGALLSLELEKGLEPSDHLQGIPPMRFFSLPRPPMSFSILSCIVQCRHPLSAKPVCRNLIRCTQQPVPRSVEFSSLFPWALVAGFIACNLDRTQRSLCRNSTTLYTSIIHRFLDCSNFIFICFELILCLFESCVWTCYLKRFISQVRDRGRFVLGSWQRTFICSSLKHFPGDRFKMIKRNNTFAIQTAV